MLCNSFEEFVSYLEANGELTRIRARVSTDLEITEITDRVIKENGNALLFENNGTDFPLLINAFGSDSRMAAALGVSRFEDITDHLDELIGLLSKAKDLGFGSKISMLPKFYTLSKWLPKKISGKGACQQVVMKDPNLFKLPILKCWPHDGGSFITLPLVHTVDPETQQPNTGMYRMQVYDKKSAGMHWHIHKDGAAHYRKHKRIGSIMPVTVTIGGDPVVTYASTAPLPPFIDEFIFAGFLRKSGVKLVKSLTNDIWIPANADIVIEGYIDPRETLKTEGPFGDHTGFYSLPDLYPVFHVTTVSHKKNAIYPTTIVGIPPKEDLFLGKVTEKIFLMPVRKTIAPEVSDMHMPAEGVFHNLVMVSVKKEYPGQPKKVANALWGAGQMMFNKVAVLFNEDVDLHDYNNILKILSENVDPATDIFFNSGPLDVLDHSSRDFAYGSKMGLDATNIRSLKPASGLSNEQNQEIIDIPGVQYIFGDLAEKGVSVLILFVEKSAGHSVKNIHDKVSSIVAECNIRFVFYLDKEANDLKLSDLLWLVAGNIDPERDTIIEKVCENTRPVVAGFDATRKSLTHDGFKRDWPNLTCMNIDTIALVDKRWNEYELGKRIESPSKRFLLYQKGDGAIAIL